MWSLETKERLANLMPEGAPLLTVDEKEKLADFMRSGRTLGHVTFSPDGRLVVAVGDNGTIHVWDVPKFDP